MGIKFPFTCDSSCASKHSATNDTALSSPWRGDKTLESYCGVRYRVERAFDSATLKRKMENPLSPPTYCMRLSMTLSPHVELSGKAIESLFEFFRHCVLNWFGSQAADLHRFLFTILFCIDQSSSGHWFTVFWSVLFYNERHFRQTNLHKTRTRLRLNQQGLELDNNRKIFCFDFMTGAVRFASVLQFFTAWRPYFEQLSQTLQFNGSQLPSLTIFIM